MQQREAVSRRHAWFSSYVATILQRDVRDIANIEGLLQFPHLLAFIASRTGGLLNMAEFSRSCGIPQTTLSRYLALLHMLFLIYTLPAWSVNPGKRLVKAPKIYLCDTGLASDLQGVTADRLQSEPSLLGPLLENFVVMELVKQTGWNPFPVRLFHYRTTAGREVDIIAENQSGECVGIEIKSSMNVSEKDFRGLKDFVEMLGKKWKRGIVFYTGEKFLPFGKNLYAVPLSFLWQV